MTNGNTVYKSIKKKIREIEDRSAEFGAALAEAEERIESLGKQREDTYIELAKTYLPELDAQTLASTLSDLRQVVQDNFNDARQRRKAIDEQRKQNRTERRAAESRAQELTDALNETAGVLESRRTVMASQLRDSTEYQLGRSQLEREEARLKANVTRHAHLQSESDRKLPAYQDDRLFQYLVKRGYGTPEYNKRSVFAPLDRLLAASMQFHEQFSTYRGLQKGPALLERRIDESKQRVADLGELVKASEGKMATQTGVEEVLQKGRTLKTEYDRTIARETELDAQYGKLDEERADIDNTKGTHHRKALTELRTYLKGETIADLRRRARGTTATSADDDFVDALEAIEQDLNTAREHASQAKRERQDISSTLSGLKDVARRFETKDYEASNSEFDRGFDVDDLLTGYILGRYDTSHVNSHIDKAQEFERQASSYTPSSSPSYESSSSSSSSWGGFDSGSGFSGGGGFDSGSGF